MQLRGRSALICKSCFFIAPVGNRTRGLSALADTSSTDTPLRTIADLRYDCVAGI